MVALEADGLPSGPAKERFVRRLFAAIAPRYDLMNVLMSAGCIHLWHRAFRRWTDLRPGDAAVDVCTGTGELALVMAEQVGPCGRVVGVDFTPEMLELAREKVRRRGLGDRVFLEEGDALALPYGDGTFDAAAMGFALRNVVDMERALAEMARVVRPGGRVLVLELSKPPSPLVRCPYFFYFYRVVPLLGRLVDRSGARTGTMRPYTYLPASLVKFPEREAVVDMFRRVGLDRVRYHGLTGGVVTLHVGVKPG